MAKITLPDGCQGLDCADGTKYDGRGGQTIEVDDRHARTISKSFYGTRGIMNSQSLTLGTRTGRRCTECSFLAQAWSATCPRCGGDTIKEQQV